MIWKVIRPDYWILDRKVRATNRLIILAVIFMVLYGVQWVYNRLLTVPLDPAQAAPFIAPVIPFGLMILSLFTLLGIGDIIAHLFMASDLELLMVAPVPDQVIFLVKLLQSSRAPFIPAFLFMTALIMFGIIWRVTPAYYLLVVLLTIAELLLITAVVMSLVIALAGIIPPQKVRSWIPILASLLAMALTLGQQPLMAWVMTNASVIDFLVNALTDTGKLTAVTLTTTLLALLSVLGGFQIFRHAFLEGWDRFQIVPDQRKRTITTSPDRPGMALFFTWVKTPMAHLMFKEWRLIRREPQGLMSLAAPVISILLMSNLFWGVQSKSETWGPVIFWYLLIFSSLLMTSIPLGVPLLSIMGEGRNIALLRSLPIPMTAVLKAKFWASLPPLFISWAIAIPIVGAWMNFPPWQIRILLGTILWGLGYTCLASMTVGVLTIDFTQEALRRRLSRGASFLIIGLNGVLALLILGTVTWLIIHLYPDSDVVQILAIFKDTRLVSLSFSANVWPPIIFFISQAVILAGLKGLWDTAVRHLEGYQAAA